MIRATRSKLIQGLLGLSLALALSCPAHAAVSEGTKSRGGKPSRKTKVLAARTKQTATGVPPARVANGWGQHSKGVEGADPTVRGQDKVLTGGGNWGGRQLPPGDPQN